MPRGGLRPGAGAPQAEESRAKDRAAARASKHGRPAVIDDGDWLTLPREGRTGNAPAWPLSKASKRELEVWRRQWKRPQALAWERLGDLTEQVARYVRYAVEAEQADATVGVRNLVRQYEDGLGISPAGMRMLRWKIGHAPKGVVPGDPPTPAAPRPVPGLSPKERLKLVRDGTGG